MNFCLGIIALRRKAGLAEFTDEVVQLEEVQDMMRKVDAYADPKVEAEGAERMRSVIEVEWHDATLLREVASMSRGMPQRPMSSDELVEKFSECANIVLTQARIEKVIQSSYQIDTLDDVNQYVELMHS